MARAGVTYHDVVKAAEAIKSQRQEPTVDRVREHLGTGSKSTIAPLLKRWRSDNGEAADNVLRPCAGCVPGRNSPGRTNGREHHRPAPRRGRAHRENGP